MTRSGWYPDPTGRFPKRWHDGDDWTASVIAADGQQGYDALPTASAPAVPAVPGSPSSPVPPPPTGASPTPPPPPSQPAAPPQPSWQADSPWQPGQPWQSGANAPALPPTQPYQQPSPAPGYAPWQPGPSSPGAAVFAPSAATRQGRNPLVLIVAGIAVGLFVVSLFVLDWAASLTYGDLRTLVKDQDVSGLADNVVKVHMSWLGWAWAALAIVAFAVLVVGNAASQRVGHALAALAAAIGAVLSAFVIVRMFRGPDDPEFGAWLLPAAYLVLLAAVVVSAQRERG